LTDERLAVRMPANLQGETMTPQQFIEFYGSQQKAAEAIGRAQSSVSDWFRAGRIPLAAQIIIERISGRKLRVTAEDADAEFEARRR
jgi:DNA-binding transcriptional regulator Cro